MDLTTARTTLQARGFDYLSTNQLDLSLNNAKNALEDAYPWPWLETTATGAPPLTIADLKHVLYVVDTIQDRRLTGLDPRDIVDLDADVDTTGAAWYWWLDGLTTVKTYPVDAAASLSVRYVKYTPELSIGSDAPLIPARYHAVWLDFAVVEAFREAGNFQMANAMLADVQARRLPQMVDVFVHRNYANPDYTSASYWNSDDW